MSEVSPVSESVESVTLKPFFVEGEWSDTNEKIIRTTSAMYCRTSIRITIVGLARAIVYMSVFESDAFLSLGNDRAKIIGCFQDRVRVDGYNWWTTVCQGSPSCKTKLTDKGSLRNALIQALTLFPEVTSLE